MPHSCVCVLEALPGHSLGTAPSPCPLEGSLRFPLAPSSASRAAQPEGAARGVGLPQRLRGRALTWDLPTDHCPALRRGGMNNLNRFSFSMVRSKCVQAGPSASSSRRALRATAEGGKRWWPLSTWRGRRLAELLWRLRCAAGGAPGSGAARPEGAAAPG